MAPTTYVSPPLNNIAKRIRALEDLADLAQHVAAALRNGTGDFVGVLLTSAVLTGNILTVVVSDPVPQNQLPRFKDWSLG